MNRRASIQPAKDDEGGRNSTAPVLTGNNGMIPLGRKITSPPPPMAPVDDVQGGWKPWSAPISFIDNGIWSWAQKASGNPNLYTRSLPPLHPAPAPAPVTEAAAVSPSAGASEVYSASTDPETAAWLLGRVRAGDSLAAGNLVRGVVELTYDFMIHQCAGVVFREFLGLCRAEEVDLLASAACRDVDLLCRVACNQYGCSSVKALVKAAVRVSSEPGGVNALRRVAVALGIQPNPLLMDGPYGLDVVNFCLSFPGIREFLPWKVMLEQWKQLTPRDSVREARGSG